MFEIDYVSDSIADNVNKYDLPSLLILSIYII